MKSIMDQQQTWLLRRFHGLCRKLGIGYEEKRQMIWDNFGVQSSADVDNHDLMNLCYTLEKVATNSVNEQLDKARKRLIAVIGSYLQEMGDNKNDIDRIKAIACRAAKVDTFNKISSDRLKSLYNAFLKRNRDLRSVDEVTANERLGNISMN